MKKNKSDKAVRLQLLALTNEVRKITLIPHDHSQKPEAAKAIPVEPKTGDRLLLLRGFGKKAIKRAQRMGLFAGSIALVGLLIKTEHDREAQIRQEQAVLTAIGPLSMPNRSEIYVAKVQIANVGQTTAYRVSGRIEFNLIFGSQSPWEPNFDPLTYKSGHLIDIPAHVQQPTSVALFTDSIGASEQQLAKQNALLDQIDLGKVSLYLHGGYAYDTEFGDRGIIKYCYIYRTRAKNMESCGGQSNQSYVIRKSWWATLWSAIPTRSSK